MYLKKRNENSVIIIDSGIDVNDLHIHENIIGGMGFIYDKVTSKITRSTEYNDENGHGTACAYLIKSCFGDVGIYAIKILDKDCRTHTRALVAALKYTLETDIRLINLSLATTNMKYKSELEDTITSLYNNGKILVSSLDNNAEISYPASLKNVVGVRGDISKSEDEFYYDKTLDIQCTTSSKRVRFLSINCENKFIGGNSKAAALLTGRIANVLKVYPKISFEDLNDMLEFDSKRENHI